MDDAKMTLGAAVTDGGRMPVFRGKTGAAISAFAKLFSAGGTCIQEQRDDTQRGRSHVTVVVEVLQLVALNESCAWARPVGSVNPLDRWQPDLKRFGRKKERCAKTIICGKLNHFRRSCNTQFRNRFCHQTRQPLKEPRMRILDQ